ncbi:substrate-binding periplasmic protein [Uliginosibacterium gangwonense]|uniref:substrate-binding periplasmic protein n=1 Tax=Uliginosibacterium gangwonense TaxID=392736 RepID=UPI0004782A64|nr:transporter substrate-binding domain-containing protein [Uliginosibacterium gangwonense]
MSWLCRLMQLAVVCLFAPFAANAEQQPPLRLVTLDYPPYIMQDANGAKGVVVDLVREVFARMNRQINIEFYPWVRATALVEAGVADAIFTIKPTPQREAYMIFPRESILAQDYVFFIRKDSPYRFNGDFQSLATARIGVVLHTSYSSRFDTAAAQGVFNRIDAASSYELNFRMLLAHRVDAVICSRLVGWQYLVGMQGADQAMVSGPPVETTVSYLAFSRKPGAEQLAAQFDQIVAKMKADGSFADIMQRYSR